jgi:hypothetical protein
MRSISQGWDPALVSLVFLGLDGCGEINESEVNKQAAATRNVQVTPPANMPKSMDELAKQAPKPARSQYKGSGYPGVR